MATLAQLEEAFVKADEAGNFEDAKAFADEIKRLRAEQQALESLETGLKEERKQTRRERIKNIADIPISLAKGTALGTVGLASIPSMIQQGQEYLFSKVPYGEQAQQIMSATPFAKPLSTPSMEQLMGLLESIPGVKYLTRYDPKTLVGEYAQTAGEFIGPSAIAAGVKKSPQMLKTAGILGGIGAGVQETQEQIGLSPIAATPLTLLTTLLGGYAMGPSKASTYAQQALKGVSDDELKLAAALEKQANDLGLSITAAELIDNKIINSLGSIVYGSKEGGKIMYDYLKNRPQEVEKIATKLMDVMIENPQSIREIYKKVGTTADKALTKAKIDRTEAAQDAGYGVANTESIQPNNVLNIIKQIDEQIENLPRGNPTVIKLNTMKKRLIKKIEYETTVDPVTGNETVRKIIIPQTNIKNLDTTLKEFKGYVDNSRTVSPDAKMKKNYINENDRLYFTNSDKDGVLDNLDLQLRTNKNYNAGKNKYEQVSNELVDVVYMHTKELQKKNITPTTITGFIANPKAASKFDIEQTYKILNSQDPDVFPNIVRLYIQDAATNAFKLQPTGQSLKSGFNLYNNLAGKNKQNFDEMLKGVAESYGVDKKTLLLGMDKFDKILERMAKIANIDNPSFPPDKFNLTREAAQIGSFMWQVKFAGKYGQYVNNKTMKELANVLTKKESVNALIELAKTNPASKDATILITRIIAGFNPIMDAQREQYLQSFSQPQISISPTAQ
jgi:hypothetical protein|tara:strand:+ start:1138 stop:3330 length:2193 start_codon:yes stop_codon:yes gene_type:complete